DLIADADGSLALSAADAETIINAGINFAAEDNITVQAASADIPTLAANIATLDAAGVNPHIDHIDATDNVASITEAQAVALVHEGVNFAAADDVTVHAAGTHLSTSLKGLHDLGV